ncbi:MAG: mechanosensitive ion channel [Phycisphaerae bacterium]|nr:mechanosensitive ion channel [Phycisphaerae bacterium]
MFLAQEAATGEAAKSPLQNPTLDGLREYGIYLLEAYGPKVLQALAVLIVGWIASRIIRGAVRRLMVRAKVDATLTGFIAHLAYMLLLALVVVTALQQLGVQSTSFVAIIGAAGLAVGFALQGSLANFAAGVMLIFFRPFRVGDYIQAGGIGATVEEIQIFATTFRTPDNVRVIVPNSSITNGVITNYSANPTRRIDLEFGIGYGDDTTKAKAIIEDILAKDARILKDPAPTVAVAALADSSVNIVCRPWVNSPEYWAVRFDLLETVKRAFDDNGITIPFPQRDVHVHQVA